MMKLIKQCLASEEVDEENIQPEMKFLNRYEQYQNLNKAQQEYVEDVVKKCLELPSDKIENYWDSNDLPNKIVKKPPDRMLKEIKSKITNK